MRQIDAVSIVVPTLNEAENIKPLVGRINAALNLADIRYEIIFIDDNSNDETVGQVRGLQRLYPVKAYLKAGKRGKAYSLQQGFKLARYNTICMIDADLQYPPEAIAPMYKLLERKQADIVITKRLSHQTPIMRRASSRVYNYVFVSALFGFDYDTQSGLKLFRKNVLAKMDLSPKQWSFDLEFIVKGLENGFRILSYDIAFGARQAGYEKINLFSSTVELASESMRLRLKSSRRRLRKAYKANVEYSEAIK